MALEPLGGDHAFRWRRFGPWPVAVLGTISGFAAAAASLSVAGQEFTGATNILVVVAAVASGFLTFLTARASAKAEDNQRRLVTMLEDQNRTLETQKALLETQKAEATKLVSDLRDAARIAMVDRSRTAESLAILAAALALVLSRPTLGRERSLGAFQAQLVNVLRETLEGPGGLLLTPTRVAFLERVDESPTFLSLRLTFSGGRGNPKWAVNGGTEDAKIAKDILGHEAPFEAGYLVEDAATARLRGDRTYLAAPERDIRSYCRVAVSANEVKWGLLCVDSWSKTASMSLADLAVVSAFADLLAVALSAVRTEPKDS